MILALKIGGGIILGGGLGLGYHFISHCAGGG